MKTITYEQLEESFFESKELEEPELTKLVNDIIPMVKQRGDKALTFYTKKYDKTDVTSFEVSKEERQESVKNLKPKTRTSITSAIRSIKEFSEKQYEPLKDFEVKKEGIILGQKIIPINKIGVYIPGGNYPLFSSALMAAIPAKVAGVKEIIACAPPTYNGTVHPLTLAASELAGVDKIFKVGGIQAIAAMAYGTESIPKIDKIVGPGNKYVNVAKKQVYGNVGIDFIAGPTEIMIIADDKANPNHIAGDLLAQAEHGMDAKPILVSSSENLIKKVEQIVSDQLNRSKNNEILKHSVEKGYFILTQNIDQAIEVANKYAPEHLELMVEHPSEIKDKVTSYGSLFLGDTSVVLGDYISGTNHILPTNHAARYRGGLSVHDFVKIVTYQQSDSKELYKIANELASLEGLKMHAKAAKIRYEK